MDSGQFAWLRHQQFQEKSEQALAPDPDVMHELKEPQVERQFLLRNAAMGSQPGTQQGPEPLGGVDMDLMEAVAVLITGVFPPAVADRPLIESPVGQAVINVVLIGVHPGSRGDEPLDQRTDRGLLDVFEHPDDDPTALLDHAKDRRLFARQGAAPSRSFQAPPPASPALFSPRPDVPYGRLPRTPHRIPPHPLEPVPAGGRRFLLATARPSAGRRLNSTPTPGRSARWTGSIP